MDIEARKRNQHNPDVDERLESESWLCEKYVDQQKSLRQIATVCDCNEETVRSRLLQYGIERRKPHNQRHPPHRIQDANGYERVDHKVGDKIEHILIHRLVAVSEYGFDNVVGKVVHHKNEHKIDNRPSNLQLMTRSEHNSHSHGEWE